MLFRSQVGDVAGPDKDTRLRTVAEPVLAMLSDELVKVDIAPSGADLRAGRTIYVHTMKDGLHLGIMQSLSRLPEPLFIVTGKRHKADLWMRGDAHLNSWGSFVGSVEIVARGEDRVLWSGKPSSGEIGRAHV